MALVLLDTDSIVNYLNGAPSSLRLLHDLRSENNLLCVCDIVLAEVWSGIRPEEEKATGEFLALLQYLPTTEAAARQAGRWRYSFARRGRPLTITDVMIAAIAHDHDATLVTGNARHYPMPELRILPLPRSSG